MRVNFLDPFYKDSFSAFHPWSRWYVEEVYHGRFIGDDSSRMKRSDSSIPVGHLEIARSGSFTPDITFPGGAFFIASPSVQEALRDVHPCEFIDVDWKHVVDAKFPQPYDDPPDDFDGLHNLPHHPELIPRLKNFREWFAPQLRLFVNLFALDTEVLQRMKFDSLFAAHEITKSLLSYELMIQQPIILSHGGFIIRGDLFDAIEEFVDPDVVQVAEFNLL